MTLQTIEISPAGEAQASLIVLHGLGADGADFIQMCDALKLPGVGPVRFVLPRAAERPITLNNGYRMRAWYDLYGMELQRREDETGLRESVREVHALIDRERARGVPAQRIVLAGFSQGCAMTLLAGLRYPERLGGLVALSGYLPLAATTAAEAHAANALVPIFMAHGRQDAMVGIERGMAARDALKALGYDIAWHDYPMEHSMCMEEVTELNRWLLKVWQ
jgi:phospholipase/carboxylesterase